MKLPLRIRKVAAAYVIEDAAETKLSYIYFEDDRTRRSTLKMLTEEEALALAKRVARLLTDDEEKR
jgi:hypothetical protein